MNEKYILGLKSIPLILIISFGFITLFDYHTFSTWVTCLVIAMVPAQILVSVVWHAEVPGFTTSLSQPAKGITLLLLSIFLGLIIAPTVLYVIGGGQTPPSPFVTNFLIHSVTVFIWMATIFQCWPLTSISDNKLIAGLLTLVLSYNVTYITFILFFDFSTMEALPFYHVSLDPEGIFPASPAIAFSVTAAAIVLLVVVTWEFWPITHFMEKYPLTGRQPYLGLIASIVVLLVSYSLYSICIKFFGLDPVQIMVRVSVSLIFGVFIVQIILQGSMFSTAIQPVRGILLTLVSGLLGLAMYLLYRFIAMSFIGEELSTDDTGHKVEFWIASAELAVTFPVIVIYCSFFNFWPLQKND